MKFKNKRILLIAALSIFTIFLMPKIAFAEDATTNSSTTEEVTEKKTICVWSAPINPTAMYTGKETTIDVGAQDGQGNDLVEGTDFIVTYENNIEMGIDTATATITGIGNWEGTHTFKYSIKGNLASATILGLKDCVYTGKEIVQNVVIKFGDKTLVEGTDYTLNYYSNKEIGAAYVQVQGKGLYTGFIGKNFDILPTTVTSVGAKWSGDGIKVTWNKNSNVAGYQIYKSTSKNGTYKKIATIYNNSTTSYQDNDVKSGKTYYYKIKTYKIVNNEEFTSQYSSIKTKLFMKKVELTVKSYNDQAKLTWKKIENADGYQIYRSTSKNGTYTKIKTITGKKTFKYYDKNIKTNKKYYYKVRVYTYINDEKSYGSYSSVKEKAELAKTTITSAKYSSSKNTIKWSKVSGVTGYKIYRSTSKNGTYTKIKTIKNNKTFSYTDKSLSLGKVYYYKIRAYKVKNGKETHGQYSDVKKIVTGSRTQQLNKVKLEPDAYFSDLYKSKVAKITKGKNTTYDKVKACYKYVVENMYHKDGYNCKHFSATFAGMIRVIGVDAHCYSGQTTTGSGGYTAHTWVELELNGKIYIFDPSIDRHLADSAKKKVKYDRFFKTESEVAKKYIKEGYTIYWSAWCVNI